MYSVSILRWPATNTCWTFWKTEQDLTVRSPQRCPSILEIGRSHLTLAAGQECDAARLCEHPLVLRPDFDTTPSIPAKVLLAERPACFCYPRCKQLISEVYCRDAGCSWLCLQNGQAYCSAKRCGVLGNVSQGLQSSARCGKTLVCGCGSRTWHD